MVTPNPHVQAYLHSLGLDPNVVLQDGWDSTHHEVLERDSFGTRREKRVWPDGFNPKLFLAFMEKDGLV